MELIRPMKQTVWRWPAVANFTLGGTGAGFYMLGLLAAPVSDEPMLSWLSFAPAIVAQAALFRLLGPLLAAIGFIALTTEAGRPLRGYNLFRHLRRSWMSRETLAAAVFIPAAGLDWLFPNPALKIIAALGAFGLMLSQGFIVYRARGVTAWNVRLMPLYFIITGLSSGSGLLLVYLSLSGQPASAALIAVALIGALAGSAIWFAYLRVNDVAFESATAELRTPASLVLTLGVGHVLPIVLLAGVLMAGPQPFALLFIGGCLIAGGALEKWGIVIQAGYLRGIVLPMMRPIAVERAGGNPPSR